MKKEKGCFSFFSVTPLPSETYITYNKMFFKTPEGGESDTFFLFFIYSSLIQYISTEVSPSSPNPHLPPIFRSTAHSEKNRPPRETNPTSHNKFIIIFNLKGWMST